MRRTVTTLKQALLIGASCLATWLPGGQAFAFCQTTTCLPSVSCVDDPEQCCILDRNGCDTNGLVVTWQSECASYAITQGGSPQRGISSAQLSEAVDRAFQRWTSVNCGLSSPSIRFENFGAAECAAVEVNSIHGGPNANLWMFRDETWPHTEPSGSGSSVNSAALALTTVTFNWMTSEMLDADVEINSAEAQFTTGDHNIFIDLDAIVTHEAGHFLGLDHTNDTTATMAPGYVPHTVDQRTLALDDERGVCASYPKNRETTSVSCDPYGTFSPECGGGGCSVVEGGVGTRGAASGSLMAFGMALLGLGALARRARLQPAKVRARPRR